MARYEQTGVDPINNEKGTITDAVYLKPFDENNPLSRSLVYLDIELPADSPDKTTVTVEASFTDGAMKLSEADRKELIKKDDMWKVNNSIKINNELDAAATAAGKTFDLTEDDVKGVIGTTIQFSAKAHYKDASRYELSKLRYLNGKA